MVSVLIHLLVEIFNAYLRRVFISEKSMGKIVRIVSVDVRTFASMQMMFIVWSRCQGSSSAQMVFSSS